MIVCPATTSSLGTSLKTKLHTLCCISHLIRQAVGGWRVNGHISVYTMAYALVTAREDTLKGRLREGAALVGRAHRCAWSHTTLAGLMGGSDGTELHEHFCNAIFCRRWPVDVL